MGEYGTVGSNGSSSGTLGSSIGPENSVVSSIGGDTGGGGLSMGIASGGCILTWSTDKARHAR
jgi:hypothetical protein